MVVLNKVLSQAVAVTQALLSIAVGTIGAVKKGLAELARGAIDPLARSRVEKERERCEDRQIEIDNEKRDILKQAKRDSRWSADAIDRYEELNRESQAIAQKLGPRKSIEAAPDYLLEKQLQERSPLSVTSICAKQVGEYPGDDVLVPLEVPEDRKPSGRHAVHPGSCLRDAFDYGSKARKERPQPYLQFLRFRIRFCRHIHLIKLTCPRREIRPRPTRLPP